MKHFFITLYLLGISLFSSAQQEEKAALLITMGDGDVVNIGEHLLGK